jgi:nucleoside-diphosphate-sugar epimerase
MDAGTTPTIYGDGTQTRDFCFVDNVVQANLLACTAPGAGGRAFNVGCGERISLLDLIDGINRILGTDLTPEFADWRAGDVRDSLADITAASDVLGYAPTIEVNEGLEKTVAWYTR